MLHVTDRYEFRVATKEDAGRLLNVALRGFLHAEPHTKALQLNEPAWHELIRWIVERSVDTEYSVMVLEKCSHKLIGFRLYSVSHRDESKDFSPFEVDFDAMTEGAKMLGNLLDTQKKKIWELRPNAKKVLRQEITYVAPDHQRQGIAYHFINLLNVEQLKADGFAGIQSEATSFANQRMLAKLGYEKLSESDPSEYIRSDGRTVTLPDETKSMQLFFLEF